MMTTLFGSATFNESPDARPLTGVNERAPQQETIKEAFSAKIKSEIHVSMPAKVVSFDEDKQTAVVQPLVRDKILNRSTGDVGFVKLPIIQDVPVCFPSGGGFTLTMPVGAGDEVLLVFTDTSFDSWWARGDVQNWVDLRRHDLSDAVAVLGMRSKPNVIDSVITDGAELRNDGGDVKVQIKNGQLVLDYKGKTVTIDDDSMVLTHSGAEIELDEQSIVFEAVPTPFEHIKLSANGSEIEFKMTIKDIMGVPTLQDTIDINATRVRINGTEV